MSAEEKVELIEGMNRERYNLETAFSVLGLPRSTYYYHKNEKVEYGEKYAYLRGPMDEIIERNPGYGYPRITKALKKTGYGVNHKVICRLVREWDYNLGRTVRKRGESGIKRAIRGSEHAADLVNGQEDIKPFEVTITDFTEILFAGGGRKAQLIPIMGMECKMVYGWAVGLSKDTALALQAWERAIETFEEYDISYQGMIVHHDRDPVFTGYTWLRQLLLEDGVRISFAMGGATDNTTMESFNGHFKGEAKTLFLDEDSMGGLERIVGKQIRYYNEDRMHSSLDYKSPMEYIAELSGKDDQK